MRLLSDAKLTKNIIQFILSCYLPRYFAQVVQAAADIEGNKVAGDIVVQPGFDAVQRVKYMSSLPNSLSAWLSN
jgi:hypothetical protein